MIKATLFFAIFFLTAFNSQAAESVHGILRVVKGEVQIKSAKDGQKTKARLGGKVFPQDTIITGKDARVKIVMTDNNEINISPDSQIVIQSYVYNPEKGQKDVLLNVIYGKVRSKVEQKYDGKTSKFQVKTPSAVAGVRGTDFMTSFNKQNGATQVVTFKGKVEFGAPGPNGTIAGAVMVQPGQTSTAAAGQTPQAPTQMPKEQLATADTETKAEDRAPSAQQAPAKEESKSDKKEEPKSEQKNETKNEAPAENKEQAKQDGGTKSPSGSAASGPAKEIGDNKQGPPAPGGSTTAMPAREPSSVAGGSMINPTDLPSSSTGPVLSAPTNFQPIMPPMTQLPTCDVCNSVIQNGSQKITIKVQTQ